VLTVVEHEDCGSKVLEVAGAAERLCDEGAYLFASAQRPQIEKHDVSLGASDELVREAGLAAATRAHKRDEARGRQKPPNGEQFSAPAYEIRERDSDAGAHAGRIGARALRTFPDCDRGDAQSLFPPRRKGVEMRKFSFAVALAAALVLGASGPARADEPGANASCAGIGSSWAGQMGLRDNVAHNTQAYAEILGVTPGYLVTTAARDHAGSFFACFGFNP